MASDYTDELADAVQSIGRGGTESVEVCQCDLCGFQATMRDIEAGECDGGFEHEDTTEAEPIGCVGAMIDGYGYVMLPKLCTPAENLATLEAWLREHIPMPTGALSRFQVEEAKSGWAASWWLEGDEPNCATGIDNCTQCSTEHEARAIAAMRAVAALLKETNNNV